MSPPVPLDRILARLRHLSLSVLTAESCTAGQLASTLTSRPGSSSVVAGGVVAYSSLLKRRLLNVPQSVIDGPGVVSEQCALAMARGALDMLHTASAEDSAVNDSPLLGNASQAISLSTTGYIDGVPSNTGQDRHLETWVACAWTRGAESGARAVRVPPKSLEASLGPSTDDARQQRKQIVVNQALDLLWDVLEELSSVRKP